MVLQGWYQSLAGTGIKSRAGTAAAAGRDSRDPASEKKKSNGNQKAE
jgi:hypothetical protein